MNITARMKSLYNTYNKTYFFPAKVSPDTSLHVISVGDNHHRRIDHNTTFHMIFLLNKLYLYHTVIINEIFITTHNTFIVHDCTYVYYRTRTFLHFCKTASILRTWKLKICLSFSFPFLFQDFNPNCFSSYYQSLMQKKCENLFACTSKTIKARNTKYPFPKS